MLAFSRLSRLSNSLIRASQCSLEANWRASNQACITCRGHASPSDGNFQPLFQAREAVKPGDTVVLWFASKAQVAVQCGDHEAFDMQVTNKNADGSAALSVEVARSSTADGRTMLAFKEATSKGASGPIAVQARSPARFVSLEVATAGGDVFVESLKEAGLVVESGGGSITVPSIKGDHAVLRSGGGAIRGSLTAAEVSVDSLGGPLQLKNLLGKSVVMDSRGGPLTMGACYADKATLRSGGGAVTIGTLKCDMARIESEGGPITVDSVQSSAQLHSGGGDIQVHVQPDTRHLELSSSGGAIQLLLTPGMPGSLLCPREVQLSLPPDLQLAAQSAEVVAPNQLRLVLQPNASGGFGGGPHEAPLSRLQAAQQGGEHGQGEAPVIEIRPGAGAVTVRQYSWIEAMQHKLKRRGQEGASS